MPTYRFRRFRLLRIGRDPAGKYTVGLAVRRFGPLVTILALCELRISRRQIGLTGLRPLAASTPLILRVPNSM